LHAEIRAAIMLAKSGKTCVHRFIISAAKQNKGKKMNKLVCGVGVNDLGYRVHVREELPKKWRQKKLEDCFYMQILCSVETHAAKML